MSELKIGPCWGFGGPEATKVDVNAVVNTCNFRFSMKKKQMVEPKFNAHAVYRYLYIYMSFDKKYAQQNIRLCQKLVASPLHLLYLETKSRCCNVTVNYGSC